MPAFIGQSPDDDTLADQTRPARSAVPVGLALETIGLPARVAIDPAGLAAGGWPVQLNLDQLWDRSLTLTARLVETEPARQWLKTVTASTVNPQQLLAHHFPLGETGPAGDAGGQTRREQALSIVILSE